MVSPTCFAYTTNLWLASLHIPPPFQAKFQNQDRDWFPFLSLFPKTMLSIQQSRFLQLPTPSIIFKPKF